LSGSLTIKACPYCAELIQDVAVKCRFCGEVLDPSLRKAKKRKRKRGGGASILRRVVFGVVWCVALTFGFGMMAGAIAGGIAGAKDPQHAREAGARAGQEVGERLGAYILLGAVIVSTAGAAFGVLPGTRASDD
jgi:hypothetical protein